MTKHNTALITLAIVLTTGVAWGEEGRRLTLREQIEQLDARLEELSASVATTLAPEVGATSEAARRAEEQIADLEERIADLSEELREVQASTDTHSDRLDDERHRIDELEGQTEGIMEREEEAARRPPVSWSESDGIVLLPSTPGAEVRLRGFLWARYDGAYNSTGAERYTSQISLPEARIRLTGSILDGLVGAAIEPSFGGEGPTLQEGYVEVRPHSAVSIRAGQMTVPFDLEWATVETEQPMVGRGELAHYFGHGRDLGAMVHGALANNQFGYAAGVWNGGGASQPNDNYDLLVALRLRYTVLGEWQGEWSDMDRRARPHLSLGLGFSYDLVDTSADDGSGRHYNRAEYQITADAMLQWYGATLAAALHYRATDAGAAGEVVNAYGFYVHGAYQVWRERIELLLRYTGYDADIQAYEDHGREVSAGLSVFLYGQLARLTALYAYQLRLPAEGPDDELRSGHAIRVQAQGMF